MPEPSRRIDRPKIFAGVILICVAALLMLAGGESPSPLVKTLRTGLLGLGIFLYLRGRFFSREEA